MKVLITGASKGIGAAIAEKFAQKGYDLALCARNLSDLERFANALKAKYVNIKILTRSVDCAKSDDVKAFIHQIKNDFGQIDILVNNAGIYTQGTILNTKLEDYTQMLNANFFAAIELTQAFVPDMITKKSGHVINITSITTKKLLVHAGAYAVSKAAMQSFTDNLREEVQQTGVRVTAIIPGATFTYSWLGTDIPEERFISATDIADAVLAAVNCSTGANMDEVIIRPTLGEI